MDTIAQLSAALAGRYSIEKPVGAGGMATVFLARDLKHNRRVAVKLLKPELGAVLGVERFLAEISVTANLQHPNLLPLFDSGEAAGLLFYVMPYVEGETLRQKIDREKQLPVDSAVHIASAIASALDYAHRNGVIHRDLKPENILMQEGEPVVADFGIALAVSNAGGNRITQTGLSLGTPQYMSPEQATGDRAIDARTDVYSLAAMLHEMLTGDPPHTGSTAQAIIARLLTDKPRNVRESRTTIPEHVAYAIEVGLEKLPADRQSTAREFADAIQGRGAPRTGATAGQGGGRRLGSPALRRAAPWAIAAAALGAAGYSATRGAPEPIAYATPMVFTVPMPTTGPLTRLGYFAISRDGTRLLFLLSGGHSTQLFERPIDSVSLRPVAETEGAVSAQYGWDARTILFRRRSRLMRLAGDGSPPASLGANTWNDPAAAPDGALYFAPDYNMALRVIRPGEVQHAAFLQRDSSTSELGHWSPHMLPDGKGVLFNSFSVPVDRSTIEVAELGSGRRTVVARGFVAPAYAQGVLFMARGSVIYAAPFDLAARRTTGPPVALINDVSNDMSSGAVAYRVSENGTLLYARESVVEPPLNSVWVSRSGTETPALPKAERTGLAKASPDGRRIAFTRKVDGYPNLIVYDSDRGSYTTITDRAATTVQFTWSRDGAHLYYSTETPVFDIFRRSMDAASPEELVMRSATDKVVRGMTPDGQRLLITNALDGVTVGTVPLGGTPRFEPLFSLGSVGPSNIAFSPDGRWIVYASSESGTSEVFVRPYPDSRRIRLAVSTGVAAVPQFARNGREIVYWEVTGSRLMAATFDPATGAVGRPSPLFGGAQYATLLDASPDGSRFLVLRKPAQVEQHAVVIVNAAAMARAKFGRP